MQFLSRGRGTSAPTPSFAALDVFHIFNIYSPKVLFRPRLDLTPPPTATGVCTSSPAPRPARCSGGWVYPVSRPFPAGVRVFEDRFPSREEHFLDRVSRLDSGWTPPAPTTPFSPVSSVPGRGRRRPQGPGTPTATISSPLPGPNLVEFA